MKAAALWLLVAGLVGTGGMTGYGSSRQTQVDSLTRQVAVLTRQVAVLTRQVEGLTGRVYATQDSISRLWRVTREFVQTWAADTIIPPPVCPGPRCPRTEFIRRFPMPPTWSQPDTLFH